MGKHKNLTVLKPKTVDMIRDLAFEYESKDLEIAYDLMQIASVARPDGPLIQKKLEAYRNRLSRSPEQNQLQQLINSGELAIIPVGFRCYTKSTIKELLGVTQATLPFDNGFFPPSSVASVFKDPIIDLHYPDDYTTHTVCIKYENFFDPELGKGIKFQKSSYEEINGLLTDKNIRNINQYLDTTFAYYTMDLKHKFVLAHYNWHQFSDDSKSNGIHDPKVNLDHLSMILNKRIKRMFDLCTKAKHIFFVFGEYQQYNFMMIDEQSYDLHDLHELENTVQDIFSTKCSVVNTTDFNSEEKFLQYL